MRGRLIRYALVKGLVGERSKALVTLQGEGVLVRAMDAPLTADGDGASYDDACCTLAECCWCEGASSARPW